MLDLNPEIVCNIITKARVIGIEDDLMPEEPTNPGDFDWTGALADYQSDLTYVELKSLINDLEPDQQITLTALMYIGRGDYDLEEWSLACDEARKIPLESRADYLIAKPLLADYLEEALAKFGYSCEEE